MNRHVNVSAFCIFIRSASTGIMFSLSLAPMSGLYLSNSRSTSVLLLDTASWRGVLLLSSLASMSALCSSNSCATSVLLFVAVSWRSVPLLLFLAWCLPYVQLIYVQKMRCFFAVAWCSIVKRCSTVAFSRFNVSLIFE